VEAGVSGVVSLLPAIKQDSQCVLINLLGYISAMIFAPWLELGI